MFKKTKSINSTCKPINRALKQHADILLFAEGVEVVNVGHDIGRLVYKISHIRELS